MYLASCLTSHLTVVSSWFIQVHERPASHPPILMSVGSDAGTIFCDLFVLTNTISQYPRVTASLNGGRVVPFTTDLKRKGRSKENAEILVVGKKTKFARFYGKLATYHHGIPLQFLTSSHHSQFVAQTCTSRIQFLKAGSWSLPLTFKLKPV